MLSIQTFIERLGVLGHPGLKISLQQEGYRDYTFGCRAGPGRATVRNLAHELAHAAEFGAAAFPQRCLMGSYVFKTRKVKVLGRYYTEPTTCSATKRELRTYALQLHLLQYAGESVNEQAFAQDAARLMTTFMHDWWQIPGQDDAERRLWCATQVLDNHGQTSADDVINRLVGWLDATDRRLSRKRTNGARKLESLSATSGSISSA
ncbi:MAG: hypothetical protein KGZ70_13160 [Hydrogenophaga sp.]|nr:hypothetical protein [Hydrogenophaga sp.]